MAVPELAEGINAAVDTLVSGALGSTVRQLAVTVAAFRDRRYKDDTDIVQWFAASLSIDKLLSGEALADQVPSLGTLDDSVADRLAPVLRNPKAQAALQQVLIARLAGGTDQHAELALASFRDALSDVDPYVDSVADSLAIYFDNEFKHIIAVLQKKRPDLLLQIRGDAIAMQMLNVLLDIDGRSRTQSTSLSPRQISEFVTKYRTKVGLTFGAIPILDEEPREASVDAIYVHTPLFEYEDPSDLESWPNSRTKIDLETVGNLVHRAVLLGDPGNGKTTAARVLMHRFSKGTADDAATARIPFFVELRKYVIGPRSDSIVGYIEYDLRKTHQSKLPPGLVDALLTSNRATVIFDGLDELLDLNAREHVARQIDSFCMEYPHARVLVTARVNGYQQTPLHDEEFLYFRLDKFGREQVAEYARRWFGLIKDAMPGEAATFVTQSDRFPDFRSNPLLLSLMCSVYRASGKLPSYRADLCKRCAETLISEWDDKRGIHVSLQVGASVLNNMLSHLSWWIYRKAASEPAVTRRTLVSRTQRFLEQHGTNSPDEAAQVAKDVVEFFLGRAWIFTEAGENARGERLYEFRHPAFLEYFAAKYLAGYHETRAKLSHYLVKNIPQQGSLWPIGDMAIQIRDSNEAGEALNPIFERMLTEAGRVDSPGKRMTPQEKTAVLRFLISCLRSASDTLNNEPLRLLTRMFIANGISLSPTQGTTPEWTRSLSELLDYGSKKKSIIAEELAVLATELLSTGNAEASGNFLWFAASLRNSEIVPDSLLDASKSAEFWIEHLTELLREHGGVVTAAAKENRYVRHAALELEVISSGQALAMDGGLGALLRTPTSYFPHDRGIVPYFQPVCTALCMGWPAFSDPWITTALEAIGQRLVAYRVRPWLLGGIDLPTDIPSVATGVAYGTGLDGHNGVPTMAYLGVAALLALLTEQHGRGQAMPSAWPPTLGPVREIAPYLKRRLGESETAPLPELLVPDEFKPLFRDWAQGGIDFSVPEGA